MTPGHSLFEALRRHSFDEGRETLAQGACFHSLEHEEPARLDFYRARVVDGLALMNNPYMASGCASGAVSDAKVS